MEKDFGSLFHHQYPHLQSAHLNFSSCGFDIRQHSTVPIYMTPRSNEVAAKGNSPPFSFSGLPDSKPSQPAEPHNWFYCLPRSRQSFSPVFTTLVEEKLAPQSIDNLGGVKEANAGPGSAQKRFLVFDQSGHQTTLIYSSPNGTSAQYLPSSLQKPAAPCNLIKDGPWIKRNANFPFEYYLGDEYDGENCRDDVESEMHEDTEELNALLYSDDDTSEDGEEISTGHSPSTMTAHDLPQWFGEIHEEVASSAGPTKRRKQLDGGPDVPSLMDTATSAKLFTYSELEHDAESSCGNSHNQVPEASISLSGKKRPRKDNIRETISLLQTIIPGGKGKDSVVVIDEAISYLISLKVKAKSLGLDTL